MPDRKALALKYAPDDYLCTWWVPGLEDEWVELAGSLEVRPLRPPRGVIYGEVPLKWERTADGGGMADFPQVVSLPVLTGTLANGGDLVVLDAEASYWSDTQGYVNGSAAILTPGNAFFASRHQRPPGKPPTVPLFNEVRFQVTGLDAVSGVAPISRGSFPGKDAEERTWSATLNDKLPLKWSTRDAEMTLGYDGRLRTGDPFEFAMRFSPVVTVTLNEPVTLRELVDRWVQPLRRIVSISTGEPESLTYLAVRTALEDVEKPPWGQVYGTGIDQDPFESDTKTVRDKHSALRCAADGTSLLDIVQEWQRLTDEHHPLIETYGSMLSVPDQHPRSRFLLLIQAIEGTYGHDTRATRTARDADYRMARTAFLERMEDILDGDDVKFLRKRLSKHLPAGLDEALTRTITDLPVNLMDDIAATAIISNIIEGPGDANKPQIALRQLRNELAHGTRGYDANALNEVVTVLERVVRGHALRALGCPDDAVTRALQEHE